MSATDKGLMATIQRMLADINALKGKGITDIIQGDNILIDRKNPRKPKISSTATGNGNTGGSSSLFPNGFEPVTESRDFQSSDEGKLLFVFGNDITLTMPAGVTFPQLSQLGYYSFGTNNHFVPKIGGTPIESLFYGGENIGELVLLNVTTDGTNDILGSVSDAFIEGKTAIKYLYDQSQNAIPLTGTETDKPVTGDIEVANNIGLYSGADDAGKSSIKLRDNILISTNIDNVSGNYGRTQISSIGLSNTVYNSGSGYTSNLEIAQEFISYSNDNPISKGISGVQDFTSNITDLDYTQKIYVGFRGTATLSSGTVTVATDKVLTGYKIYVSVNTPSGTQGFLSAPTGSIVDATSFVINSTNAGDNSTVNWWIAP